MITKDISRNRYIIAFTLTDNNIAEFFVVKYTAILILNFGFTEELWFNDNILYLGTSSEENVPTFLKNEIVKK